MIGIRFIDDVTVDVRSEDRPGVRENIRNPENKPIRWLLPGVDNGLDSYYLGSLDKYKPARLG